MIDYFKVCAYRKAIKVASPLWNTEEFIKYFAKIESHNYPHVIVTQELFLTGYSCDELFFDSTLVSATNQAISAILSFSSKIDSALIIGCPLYINHGLFNVALVIFKGSILGAIPKTYIPIGSEFYEARYFDKLDINSSIQINAFGSQFELGCAQIFELYNGSNSVSLPITFSAEICEDMWAPISPSTFSFVNGANIVFNLSASNALHLKRATRRTLANAQTQKFQSAYIYISAGHGESNNDMVWDGDIFVSCCGKTQYSNEAFEQSSLSFIALPEYAFKSARYRSRTSNCYSRSVSASKSTRIRTQVDASCDTSLYVRLDCVLRYPYSNSNSELMDDSFGEYIIASLSQALFTRMSGASATGYVLGVSGGLDSTFALLILNEFKLRYRLASKVIMPVTMPSCNTSNETLSDVYELCSSLQLDLQEISLQPSVDLRLTQLGRDPHTSEKDVTYENIQAGERTSYLFRYANSVNALVLGTGDLSELALGWCTYGVGDQMSHYSLNSGIPKTVIKQFIHWYLSKPAVDKRLRSVLRAINSRTISPELLPPASDGKLLQDTESIIGKYTLIDFFLYYYLEYSLGFDQLGVLASRAFFGMLSDEEIDLVVASFKKRFFKSQFKRTALPNGPKILHNGSLSPRSDWRQPSVNYIDH